MMPDAYFPGNLPSHLHERRGGMMASSSDTSWVSYLMGMIGALFTAGAGTAAHIHMRINRGEDQRRQDLADAIQELRGQITKAETAAKEGDNAIWKDIISERRQSREFREGVNRDMATKSDMRDINLNIQSMERRIMDALRGVDRGNAG
ncbi:MAG: hypothetical protein KGL35_27420 [Bradyrhizobium sp.]|nr:hypothetical protein [Bradyrhizobium sp.]